MDQPSRDEQAPEHQSVWLATSPLLRGRPGEALAADITVDVVVVGAGCTGLTAALLLQREGFSVAVVEAREVGRGTSGGTTGKVTTQHGLIYSELVRRHGRRNAQLYADANRAGLELIAALAGEMDCEFTRAAAYVYTRTPDRIPTMTAEAEQAADLGLPARLDTDTGLPFDVAAAVRFDNQAHVHPGRYLDGLTQAFIAAGGRLFEHSRATDITDANESVQVTCVHAAAPQPDRVSHTITASHCIVATLLPIGVIGGCFARTTPTRSYGLALRLGTAAPPHMTISADDDSYSTRPWPDAGPNGLIVVGQGHRVGEDIDTEQRYVALEEWARTAFDVASVDYRWSAQDYRTVDGVPYVGPVPLRRRVLVATGFAKWGLTNGAAAALMCTDVIAGRQSPWLTAFDVGRIGDVRAVIETAKANLTSGVQLVAGALTSDSPTCTHLGCKLHWNPAETSWDCSCHGSRFTATGDVLEGPAVAPLKLRNG
jgi:glycine/D-amino acid oxidase-like deaminating enzyme